MALLLLLERRQGSSSRVWGYIQQLPASIDTPVRWSEDDLTQLQYQPAIQEVWREGQDVPLDSRSLSFAEEIDRMVREGCMAQQQHQPANEEVWSEGSKG